MTDVSYYTDADARSGLRHDRVQGSMPADALRNWRRLIPNATELGLANALWYNTDRLCHKVSIPVRVIRYALLAQPVRDRPLLPGHRGAGIAVREVSAREPALLDMDGTPAALAFREEQGAICLAAFAEGVMIGCLWFCLGPYQEDEVRCLFTPAPEGQTAWDFGAYGRTASPTGFLSHPSPVEVLV
ncbi:MAG: hypothetical protein EA405_11900 [Rhodospirillales bacterium]|nr:MAG: hypothetical protein EA405_11900 [Rhodospirillales bacterium]